MACSFDRGRETHERVVELVQALHEVQISPANAREICSRLKDAPSQTECIISAVEKLSRKAPRAARDLCAALHGPPGSWECHFQVAERSGNVEWCADAGDFAFDCRIHLWTAALNTLPREPTAAEAWAHANFSRFGFHTDDIRPWQAFSMVLLRRELPLNRGQCAQLATAQRRNACESSGIAIYRDRLRWHLDTVGIPCLGSPLSPNLDPGADPVLSAMLQEARQSVPCKDQTP